MGRRSEEQVGEAEVRICWFVGKGYEDRTFELSRNFAPARRRLYGMQLAQRRHSGKFVAARAFGGRRSRCIRCDDRFEPRCLGGMAEMPIKLALPFINSDQVQPGDLLLKFGNGSRIGNAITLGQKTFQKHLKQGNANIMHGGVMFDNTIIIEAQGAGINAHDLRIQNRSFDYEVYRCLLANVAQGAAMAAKVVFDAHSSHNKSVKYNHFGTLKALFNTPKVANKGAVDVTLDRLVTGKGDKFFCTQFVVYCFQLAAENNGLACQNLFDLADTYYSPTRLKDSLFRSPYFFKAGVLRADHR